MIMVPKEPKVFEEDEEEEEEAAPTSMAEIMEWVSMIQEMEDPLNDDWRMIAVERPQYCLFSVDADDLTTTCEFVSASMMLYEVGMVCEDLSGNFYVMDTGMDITAVDNGIPTVEFTMTFTSKTSEFDAYSEEGVAL